MKAAGDAPQLELSRDPNAKVSLCDLISQTWPISSNFCLPLPRLSSLLTFRIATPLCLPWHDRSAVPYWSRDPVPKLSESCKPTSIPPPRRTTLIHRALPSAYQIKRGTLDSHFSWATVPDRSFAHLRLGTALRTQLHNFLAPPLLNRSPDQAFVLFTNIGLSYIATMAVGNKVFAPAIFFIAAREALEASLVIGILSGMLENLVMHTKSSDELESEDSLTEQEKADAQRKKRTIVRKLRKVVRILFFPSLHAMNSY